MASLFRRTLVSISAVLALVALVACQDLGASSTSSSLAQKYQEMYQPTVVVVAQGIDALGSGVIVSREGDDYLILTGRHVVGDEQEVWVYPSGHSTPKYLGKVLRISVEQDLALVHVKIKDDRPETRLCKTEPVMFEEVYAVGAGLAQPLFPTSGIVGNPRYYFEDYPNTRYVQHSAIISPGNSGGPLYKYEEGSYCLTGINLRGSPSYQQFSYAVHLHELYTFLGNTSAIKRHL